MSVKTTRRLLTELSNFIPSPASVISLQPLGDANLLEWTATILGPVETAFQNHRFELKIILPENYPASPPKISFLPSSKVFHPNITLATGEICLDILKTEWSPIWNLNSVCLAIQSLLANPGEMSPLNVDAANLVRCGDVIGYESMVRLYLDG